ncbi:hypothetical protein ACO1O0_001581 [Amphichorda felina]
MEYVPGKTAMKVLEGAKDEAAEDAVYASIAFALSELHRIPAPPGTPPRGAGGGRIRNDAFDLRETPVDYQSVVQLEEHFNEFLSRTRNKTRFQDLTREPMVFCYSDVWLGNFMIGHDGSVTVIDFADASFLPSSFSKFVTQWRWGDIKRDITDIVITPTAKGVDNTRAISVVAGYIVQASGSFSKIGRRMLDVKNDAYPDPILDNLDDVDKVMVDALGQPIVNYSIYVSK